MQRWFFRMTATAGLLLYFFASVAQQQTDTVWLKELVVKDALLRRDSLTDPWAGGMTGIASALQRNSAVYIRSAVPGGLSTVSVRGQAPHQVPVLWHGINLQYAMNGVYDLALLPAGQYDIALSEESLLPDAYRGVSLNTVWPVQPPRFQMVYRVASFGDHHLQGRVRGRYRNLRYTLFGNGQTARNNFTYINPLVPGQARLELPNAALRIGHGGLDMQWHSERDSFEMHGLYTAAWRQIPPTMTESHSDAVQQDTSLKWTARYTRVFRRFALTWQPAYIRDVNQFAPDLHQTELLFSQSQISGMLGSGRAIARHTIQQEKVLSTAFPDRVRQIQHIAQLLYQWEVNSSLRVEGSLQNTWHPIQPGLQPTFYLLGNYTGKRFRSHLKIGTARRMPTLNDLFWPGSGNPDLVPEHTLYALSSFQADIVDSRQVRLRLSWEPEVKSIDQYILWVPADNQRWKPENVKSVLVWSQDLSVRLTRNFVRGQWNAISSLHWVRARANAVYHNSQRTALGKQLAYMPEWQWRQAVDLSLHSGWSARLQYAFTGLRYTTRDNAQWLPPVHLVDLEFERRFNIGESRWRMTMAVQNLLNQSYQWIAFRPMPGRSFDATLSWSW